MKFPLPILFWLWPFCALTQAREVMASDSSLPARPVLERSRQTVTKNAENKPEILSSGFIDIINNGQVNASARFLRLYIGEPGKLAIPLSIYSGVSSNNFQNQQLPGGQRSNDQLVSNFINPLSGLANISIDGILFFRRRPVKITRAGFLYHTGIRVLTGYRTGAISDPLTGKPLNFLNSFGTSGFYFQTGAWERNNTRNLGIFWLTGRYIICKSGNSQLKQILPGIETSGFYQGWSLAWGVEINNLVNIKVVYYNYIRRPEIDYSFPIYQFSFNYSMK